MKKSELIKLMQYNNPHLKDDDIKNCINIFFDTLSQSLIDEINIELRGFGVFVIKQTNRQKYRNPKNGEKVYVPKSKKILFKQSDFLKKIVNE